MRPSGYRYLARCLVPFALSSFAPTAVPLASGLHSLSFFSFPDRFLSSALFRFPATQPSVSSVPSSSRLRLTLLFRCSAFLSVRCLFPSVRLISHPSFRLSVLGLLFVSFRPSLLRSHSRSTGDRLVLSLSAIAASLSLPFVRFRSAS